MAKQDTIHIEEPDVTPLINVNLMILVMTLAIASHAAKMLPLVLPKAAETEFVEMDQAVGLKIAPDGSYAFKDAEGMSKDDLVGAIEQVEPGEIILISMDPKAKYEALVWAVDCIMARPTLKVAFGQPAPPAPAPTDGPAAPAAPPVPEPADAG